MIKLKNNKNGLETIVTPTIFSDGTSQIWQLPDDVFKWGEKYTITWKFESEAEIFQLLQLKALIDNNTSIVTYLIIPYLPYARQDKQVNNKLSFALNPFLNLITGIFDTTGITVFDVHNKNALFSHGTFEINNIGPEKYILKSLVKSQADLLCFPDKGAAARYNIHYDCIVADKVRDQATGKITGHTLLEHEYDLWEKTVLIADDLCDGGATFTSMSKMLHNQGVKHVDLYTSHGIYSKGVHLLNELGKIRNIYTTDSYIKSQEMLLKHDNVTIYKLEL